jgi:hypothetical protein
MIESHYRMRQPIRETAGITNSDMSLRQRWHHQHNQDTDHET